MVVGIPRNTKYIMILLFQTLHYQYTSSLDKFTVWIKRKIYLAYGPVNRNVRSYFYYKLEIYKIGIKSYYFIIIIIKDYYETVFVRIKLVIKLKENKSWSSSYVGLPLI